MTYVYADSTAVLGPLAAYAEPHCYDLCAQHSVRLTGPRGWEIVRLDPGPLGAGPMGGPSGHDDLTALVDAVREVTIPAPADAEQGTRGVELGHRRHLRVLRPPEG